MFEDLKTKINIQNLQKLKQKQTKARYAQSHQQNNSDVHASHDYDSSLDDLQIELEEREQNFNDLNFHQSQEDNCGNFLKKDDSIPLRILKKVQNQLQLVKEQSKIDRDSHERQMEYERELFKRKEQWMQTENQKLKFLVKKYKQQQEQVKRLKKDIQNYEEIKDSFEEKIEKLSNDNRNLNKIVDQMQKQSNQREQEQAKQITEYQLGDEGQKMKKILSKVSHLESQIENERKMNEEKKKSYHKLLQQIQNLKQKVCEKQDQILTLKQAKEQISVTKESELKEEILSLKKRNKYLEDTFIQKISEITRLQAHLVSNASLSHHYSLTGNKKGEHESSLSLHEQSPIKPSPFSQRKSKQNFDNPENTKKMGKHLKRQEQLEENQDYACKCCHKKVQKYKQKLNEANKKIVYFIEQKIEGVRKESYQRKSYQTYKARGRITSWNNTLTS